MAKSLVFVGGGHAHLYSLQRAARLARAGCAVTLVSPERFQYYSGMGPGLLGGTYTPEEARFDLRRLCEQGGVAFVEDAVAAVDPGARRLTLAGGGSLAYDLASFNTGSKVADASVPGAAEHAVPVKPIHNLFRVREAILGHGGADPLRLAV
ncbi:MAG TPA: FAD-dependent oxidoreductase, partial [Deferrisomatales bacterium]|nr:FAD-dependent oxidoreductase [Deferrisomatales bacterium]